MSAEKEPLAEIRDYEPDQLLATVSNSSAPKENRALAYALLKEKYGYLPRVHWHLRKLESELFSIGIIGLGEVDSLPNIPPTTEG